MNQIFSAYLKFVQLPNEAKAKHKIKIGAKVPRFDLVEMAGYYKPLESLTDKKGIVKLYLNETRGIIDSPDNRRAERFLMGKNSLNFSSVYVMREADSFLYGFGNPNAELTYSKKKTPNPFYNYRNDGYLFVIAKDWSTIEILVIENGKFTIQGNTTALAEGVYNDVLENMRKTAQTFYNY